MNHGSWLLVRSLLLRRRGRNLLVGLVLAAAALLFVTALGIRHGLARPFEVMYEAQRGSHAVLVFDARLHEPNAVARWWHSRPGVVGVLGPLPLVHVPPPSHQGRELSKQLWLVEHPGAALGQDVPRVVSGTPADGPGAGEIWIPTALAFEANIQPGDELSIPTPSGLAPLRVSAVVVDPQFGTPFMNPTRAWVRAGSLPSMFPAGALDSCLVAVRLADPQAIEGEWESFTHWANGAFNGIVILHANIQMAWLGLGQVVGLLLVGFSSLCLVVALLLLYATISGSIAADQRVIGILKAQGWAPADLTGVHLLAYLLVGALFVPIGLAAGQVATHEVTALLLRSMGAAPPDTGSLLRSAIAFAVLEVAVAGTVWMASGAARTLKPVEAMRNAALGAASTAVPRRLRLRLGVSAALALRTLFRPRRRAVLLCAAIAFTAAVAAFSVNVSHTFAMMGSRLSVWGFDEADVRVTRQSARARVEHASLVAQLSRRPGVRALLPADLLVEGAVPARDGKPARSLLGTAAQGPFEAAGYRTVEGHNPADDSQIALALNTARSYGVGVGDRFELVLRGQRTSFTVSGIYQSISNLGQGFRVRVGAVQAADPLYVPGQYAVVLEPGVDRAAFIRALHAEYGEVLVAEPGDRFLADAIGTITTATSAAFGLVVALFLLATCAFVFSTTVMDLRERRRTFGVLKAAGMSPAQLKAVPTLRSGVLALVGVAVGLLAWRAAAGALLTAVFSGLGLATFPLSATVWGTALAVGAIPLGCALTARVAARLLSDCDVHSLVEE